MYLATTPHGTQTGNVSGHLNDLQEGTLWLSTIKFPLTLTNLGHMYGLWLKCLNKEVHIIYLIKLGISNFWSVKINPWETFHGHKFEIHVGI